MDGHYPERLTETLSRYREETAETIGRWCRVGRISVEVALDFIELLEDDFTSDQTASHFDGVFGGQQAVPPGYDTFEFIEGN